MEAVIPWPGLVRLIERTIPSTAKVRQRGTGEDAADYFLQQWFKLSDRRRKTPIYDSESMPAASSGVELGEEVVPARDHDFCAFRHLLVQHGLTQAIFNLEIHPVWVEERGCCCALGNHRRRDHHRVAESTKNSATATRPGDEQTHKAARCTSG